MATWVPVIVATLSAGLSGYFALRARSAELQAQRILDLERRLAASKGEVFEPLIEAIGRFWNRVGEGKDASPSWYEANVLPHFKRFGHWVQVYGSDASVRLYHRYMQAIFNDAPSNVTMRHMAELVLAARRELGPPDTSIDALDIMGIRITDIYEHGKPLPWTVLPAKELYDTEGWTPPWGNRFDDFDDS